MIRRVINIIGAVADSEFSIYWNGIDNCEVIRVKDMVIIIKNDSITVKDEKTQEWDHNYDSEKAEVLDYISHKLTE